MNKQFFITLLILALAIEAPGATHVTQYDLIATTAPTKTTFKTWKPLHTAAYNNEVLLIEDLLSEGRYIDPHDNLGRTPLFWAAIKGNSAAVRVLIYYFADINAKSKSGFTPLHAASRYGHIEVMHLLLKAHAKVNERDDDDNTPLFYAIQSENPKAVALLLDHGADVDIQNKGGKTPLYEAIVYNSAPVVGLLIKHKAAVNNINSKKGLTPLSRALMSSTINTAIALMLYAAGARLNINPFNIFVHAIFQHNMDTLRLLVGIGANINATDDQGFTPLYAAIQIDDINTTNYLIKHKANVNSRDNAGNTPLMSAIVNTDNVNLVQSLISHGAHINVENNDGATPLLIAIQLNRIAFVKALLNAGADIYYRNSRGISAASLLDDPNVNLTSDMARLLAERRVMTPAKNKKPVFNIGE